MLKIGVLLAAAVVLFDCSGHAANLGKANGLHTKRESNMLGKLLKNKAMTVKFKFSFGLL
jgi:hypothetical protein